MIEGEVLERYACLVYRLAYIKVRHATDADDVFQEVFLRYVRKHPRFENEEHRKAWLIRVTINCANRHLTSAWRRKTGPLEDKMAVEEGPGVELRMLMEELPGPYREVVHLFYQEDMTIDAVAKALHRKPSTVRTQLTRARRLLRAQWEAEK